MVKCIGAGIFHKGQLCLKHPVLATEEKENICPAGLWLKRWFSYDAGSTSNRSLDMQAIPGLWTKETAAAKEHQDLINRIVVNLDIIGFTDLAVQQKCYVVTGGMIAEELAHIVAEKLSCNAAFVKLFSVDGLEIDGGTLICSLYRLHMSPDGFLDLKCDSGTKPSPFYQVKSASSARKGRQIILDPSANIPVESLVFVNDEVPYPPCIISTKTEAMKAATMRKGGIFGSCSIVFGSCANGRLEF